VTDLFSILAFSYCAFHAQRCEECCVVVRDGRLVFCVLYLKKLPTSRLLKTPQCIPHYEHHSLLPFHLPCSSVFIPCTLLSLCLPSSLSNRRQKGFLELCRSWYMNCLFPLISSIWLMAMVEGNMKICRVLPSHLSRCVVW